MAFALGMLLNAPSQIFRLVMDFCGMQNLHKQSLFDTNVWGKLVRWGSGLVRSTSLGVRSYAYKSVVHAYKC